MPPGHERNVVYTYRYLRAAMIALLLMLVFSVGYQWWAETARTCWLGSISAYYYTPARTIFVGSLCALGACLIAYKGHSSEEDVLLNFSGFMAFVVAMVPTVPDNLCGPNAYSQTLPEIALAVRNNIWSLIVVTIVAAAIGIWLRRRSSAADRGNPSNLTIVVWLACGAVLTAEMILFLLLRPRFIEISHGVAAVTMVAGIIAVMVSSAFRADDRHKALGEDGPDALTVQKSAKFYKNIYLLIAAALVITLVGSVGVALLTNFDHLILWVELVVIVLFGAYWCVQTRELWNLRDSAATSSVSQDSKSTVPTTPTPPAEELESVPPGFGFDRDAEGREGQTVAE